MSDHNHGADPGSVWITEQGSSQKVILEKAIQKAIEGGWTYIGKPENGWGVGAGQWLTSEHHLTINRGQLGDELIHRNVIIFNHDFAKALWGEGNNPLNLEPKDLTPLWQYHLQQMVLAEDPIKYLGENL